MLEAHPKEIDMTIINRQTTYNNGLHRDKGLDAEENTDLLECAKLGDVNAFVRLVGPYERGLFSVILRITKHQEDAEDAMQEALLRAYTHIKTFRGESRFRTWFTRIGVNQALMCLRARRRSTVLLAEEDSVILDLPDSCPNPEQHCRNAEYEAVLYRMIDTLPSSFRNVVVMRYLRECSTEETANIMGISVAATKSRLLRARRHLRQRLGKNLESADATDVS